MVTVNVQTAELTPVTLSADRVVRIANGYAEVIQIPTVGGNETYQFELSGTSLSANYGTSTLYTTVATSTWEHVAITYDNSTVRLYKNGVEISSVPYKASDPAMFKDDFGIVIGSLLNADIDEMRLSNTARSAVWLTTEYNNINAPTSFISWDAEEKGGGPVAYWSFDEGYASTTYDRIGNNDGTLQSNTLWVDGKFGKALSFDGTDDYVSVGDIGMEINAVSFWIYADNDSKDIIDFDSGTHSIEVSGGTVSATGFSSPTIYINGQEETALTTGAWHHIAVTTDTAFNSNAVDIGTETSFFDGTIDEVKLFNRALTTEEVLAEYNASGGAGGAAVALGGQPADGGGAPVGWWRFEEQSESTAYDLSGNFNNGTLTNGPVWTTQGKVGGAVSFDGSDDYIGVLDSESLDITGAVTVKFWVKPNIFSCGETVTDVDGNTYNTILIGSQCWMTENMRTTKYPSGSSITKGCITEGCGDWATDQALYSCPPDAATNNVEDCAAAASLGMLYQWSAAMNGGVSCNGTGAPPNDACATPVQGICPTGWHMPSHYEWTTLERAVCTSGTCATDFLYDEIATGWKGTDEGSRLAGNVADQNWTANILTGEADFGTSGFNLPASGYRNTLSNYSSRATNAFVWSSLESGGSAWSRYLGYANATVSRPAYGKAYGFSVRCLKD
jgi:uncharacterized protein (TIGR02145 family)